MVSRGYALRTGIPARTARGVGGALNRVLLTGRLTRDPEMRVVTNGTNVSQFSIATNEHRGGQEKAEFHIKGKV
jgi:primosomal replication protein N